MVWGVVQPAAHRAAMDATGNRKKIRRCPARGRRGRA